MFITLVLVILLAAPSRGASDISLRFTALRFTQEKSTYIQFTPDFSRYTHAISVCGWIKSLGSAAFPTVFYYRGGELTMLDDGGHIGIFGSYLHLKSKFSVSKRTWYHTCITWSASSRSHKYYVNGELLGSQQTTSGRLLRTGLTLTLGNWGGNTANHEFGSEMVYLNFYAKELSASEVREMVNDGICANMAVDEHEEVRLLKWEDIMRKTRSGTITEVDMTGSCTSTYALARRLSSQEEQFEAKLKATENKLNDTAEDLAETRKELAAKKASELKLKQELKNVSNQLNLTLVELEDVTTELNETSEELIEVERRFNETEGELEKANYNKTKNKWDWGIFLSEQYLNQTVSSEQSEQIRTSWDDIAQRLVGYTITDELINFWKIVDCVGEDDRPWSMLYSEAYFNKELTQELAQELTSIWDGISEKLVGVTMTEEVVELLKYISEETNCYCGN